MWDPQIEITLNMPPSINVAYAGYPKRHKSDVYKNWQRWIFLEKNWRIHWDEWLEVSYTFYFPLYTKKGLKKIRDVANYEKCLTDTICELIPWFEDHKIKRISMEKIDSNEEKVKIIVKELWKN